MVRAKEQKPARRRKAAAKKRVSARAAEKRAAEHFAAGILTRGEAVPEPSPGQDLPPGATHTFDPKAAKDGVPRPGSLRRRRFSLR
jgi:hypothetical protein